MRQLWTLPDARRLLSSFGVLAATLSLVAWPAVATGADLPPGLRVEEMVTGLREPVAFAFSADGRIFVNERATGRIRVVHEGILLAKELTRVAVTATGERGLLGLALDPRFPNVPHLYVLHTRSPERQRITRFTVRGNEGTNPVTIIDDIPASRIHNGGGLGFGPDGKLYYSIGDTGREAWARHPHRVPGKIHRVNRNGTIPEDNPWPGQSAYCLGCRNSFDFTFRANSVPAVLYASENGPASDDEVNRIVAGADYGWPRVTGVAETEPYQDPLVAWTPTTAPVGIVLYQGHHLPAEYAGNLFVAEFNTGRIRQLVLDNDGKTCRRMTIFLDGGYGPLFDLAVAPDGSLWFSNSTALYRISSAEGWPRFIRGNVDGLNGVDARDAAFLLHYLLAEGPDPVCYSAADVNDDELIDLSDVSTLLGFLFGQVPELPDPFPNCGEDAISPLPCTRNPPCD